MPETEIIKVNHEDPDPDSIERAALLLRKGGLVAFSTETVYGLGADWRNKKVLYRLYEVKGRPRQKAFTVAISNLNQLAELGCKVSGYGFRLIEKFWPGPLTLILQTRQGEKIGFRVPDDNVALALLRKAAIPLALPSANLSGNSPPLTAADVLKDLEGRIEMVLDSGKTKLGVESTVLDLTAHPPQILREGAVKASELKKIPRKSVLFVCTGNSCRSIMAEGFLKKALQEKGRYDIEVYSAGVAGIRGFSPTEETIQVMKEKDSDVRDYKTKPLTLDLVNRADLILVMQNRHKKEIMHRTPQVKDKVFLLREYTDDELRKDGHGLEVQDPVTQPLETYREVRDIIKRNVDKLMGMI